MRQTCPPKRHGSILVLVVILLCVLLALAGLLIDIGMARLTQLHLRSVSESAAIEGGWQMAMNAEPATTRQAVIERADEMSDSWGPRRIEFKGGFDLDNDGVPESSQLISEGTLGDAVRPTLDRNVGNAPEGDIVFGVYNASIVPESLPGQPFGYDRSPTFRPNDPDGQETNALLARLRRTGEDVAGGTSAERLTNLWSRGSLLDFGLKGAGIAVRGETIVELMPVVAVGRAQHERFPGLLAGVAIEWSSIELEVFSVDDLVNVSDAYWIGVPAEPDEEPVIMPGGDGYFYLPIVDSVSSEDQPPRVISFTLVEKSGERLTRTTFDQTGFQHMNASSNLALVFDAFRNPETREIVQMTESVDTRVSAISQVLRSNASRQSDADMAELMREYFVRAPCLVRSNQIHGVSP